MKVTVMPTDTNFTQCSWKGSKSPEKRPGGKEDQRKNPDYPDRRTVKIRIL